MVRKVHCEKKTKIYIPKTVNPQIISYRSAESIQQVVKTDNTSGSTAK